jgi:hypothetical protein
METEERLDNMTERVEGILEINKFARNSDKRLIYEVLKQYYGLDMPFEDFVNFPSFESIRRVRQKIQADGRFKPTDKEVWVRRGMEEEAYHRYFSKRNEDLNNFVEFK